MIPAGMYGSAHWSTPPVVITATELLAGQNGSNGTTFTTAQITPSANKLIIVALMTGSTSPTPTLTGCGLTWTRMLDATNTNNSANALWLFRAMGTPTTGTLTVSWNATASNTAWHIVEFGGVTQGNNGANAIAQTVKATPTAIVSSIDMSLPNVPTGATYGVFSVYSNSGTGGIVPNAGYTGFPQIVATSPNMHQKVMWRQDGTQSIGASWELTQISCGIGLEII